MKCFDRLGELMSGEGRHDAVMRALAVLVDEHGGLAGLGQRFRDIGLDAVLESWLGSGENMALTPADVYMALGEKAVGQFADMMETTSLNAAKVMAEALPELFDRLTPNGELPEPEDGFVRMFSVLGTLFER
ncbi:DUF937 domain-containing protein [Aquitalea sp. S1-19]|nr:DUF937 domain-containing protein [Aquitalea sp. S1-19]